MTPPPPHRRASKSRAALAKALAAREALLRRRRGAELALRLAETLRDAHALLGIPLDAGSDTRRFMFLFSVVIPLFFLECGVGR